MPMTVLHYAAFSTDPAGGNPAGVVLDARGASSDEMLAVAAHLGYSETAFLSPRDDTVFDVRYFSPQVEVPFCGHATIAAAAAFAQRHGGGPLTFHTKAGQVTVDTTIDDRGVAATLVSVPPSISGVSGADRAALLDALRWTEDDLDPTLPMRVAYAGAHHPVVAVRTRQQLADLDYDFPALRDLMHAAGWVTIQIVWREDACVFHARNPFPPGGVIEDPATGAAAAALGGYLRELELVKLPATVTVYQGMDMGRPGIITVGIPTDRQLGISVSGRAVRMLP